MECITERCQNALKIADAVEETDVFDVAQPQPMGARRFWRLPAKSQFALHTGDLV
jgi:hypothetical protein